ncbi:MsnO8 family LLM class oxidoreductase [Pantoea sp. Bo_2]|uniref:MsnO8 family LLM class oxidoreductase n=1 Tax=unclassified Pantoea TaxID=2630326 RepID=UPI0012321539|nr:MULTISPECIES: MsnO8 family LLM class oxidoreductase [unclassified Pantoea]KAA5948288.1 MsnO8 family LLM class oxidoreductase [Pantoea sp. VH_3]KAA5953558.1 MsnO8 family LLM class oxidoreductase [Pantoea sp. VH_25]KAA5956606.1 MsnO8 family LLM class oxidoreductase [Pantoea sp. VH_24]KAA5960451.1 MsnO8 family LLM class oxidoreductase [Pantoea sp. VH_16]KAA5965023.1 MsnO8 family LLM class oxidoreductase [Pantoea sp. VH_18]
MAYRLSLLDKAPVLQGESPAAALQRTLQLAQLAEEWGYHRFWLAEHHNTAQLASPSPEVLIAWIVAQTRHIRVGSGGVMLQHYSPYKVAENFNLLASLAPGRIDLGVGKAPGGLPLSTHALQQGVDAAKKGSFAEQLQLLDSWLKHTQVQPDDEGLAATPLPSRPANRFLLGASEESARLAASLGWQFVFAAHINGDRQLLEHALSTFSRLSNGQRALVAVQVVVADSPAQADLLVSTLRHYHVSVKDGPGVNVASLEQAERYVRQGGYRDYQIEPRTPSLLKGTAAQVHAQLDALHHNFDIDEFVIDTPITEPVARLQSLQLLATQHLVAA